VTDYLGIFEKNTEIAQTIGLYFFSVKVMYQFSQKWIGLHFGRLFTNASGHPAWPFFGRNNLGD
jgi:hypothetical protein